MAFACYLGVLATARAVPRRLLLAAIVALVAAFALAPPLLSQDVFSYIAYARLDAEHGLNPYDVAPNAVAGDPVFAYVGWKDTVSAYGPLFAIATYPLGLTSVPLALWTMKALAAAAVLMLAALVARLAAIRGSDPGLAAAFVALNPLVLAHVVGGAHNDSLMMLLVMAAIAALVAGRDAIAGVGVVGAAVIKVSAAFAAPFALDGSDRRGRLLTGIAVGLGAAVAVSLAAFGSHAAEAIGLAGENQATTSRYSLPSTVSRIVDVDIDVVRIAALCLYAVLVAALLYRCARGEDWIRCAAWAALGLLVATGWLLPWYLIWALPLVAIARDRALVGATLALTAFQLVNRVPL